MIRPTFIILCLALRVLACCSHCWWRWNAYLLDNFCNKTKGGKYVYKSSLPRYSRDNVCVSMSIHTAMESYCCSIDLSVAIQQFGSSTTSEEYETTNFLVRWLYNWINFRTTIYEIYIWGTRLKGGIAFWLVQFFLTKPISTKYKTKNTLLNLSE